MLVLQSNMSPEENRLNEIHLAVREPGVPCGHESDMQALRAYPRYHPYSYVFSPDVVGVDIVKNIESFAPRLVVLHGINGGFAKVEDLARIRQKIVWRLPDCWTFTGGCFYFGNCKRYLTGCGQCPKLGSDNPDDISHERWLRKREAWSQMDMTVVVPTLWMEKLVKESPLLRDKPVYSIPNGLDLTRHYPVDKQLARKALRIPIDKKVILFGAIYAFDARKGISCLIDALRLLEARHRDEYYFVVFGGGAADLRLGIPVRFLGYLSDPYLLQLAYSAADVMVVPSLEEAFGQTGTEAMACATPVISFLETGLASIVRHKRTGYLARFADEITIYQNFRDSCKQRSDGLKILLVGNLAYNPERIYALEKAGHSLYGLWIKEARYTFATVGSLPFGNVKDIFYDKDWKKKVEQIKPDVVYALGNWDTVDLAYEVISADLGIPFVLHFKEGPLFTMNAGSWPKLYEIYTKADGCIFISEENKKWYELFCGLINDSIVIDLDLPIKDLFGGQFNRKLSQTDGEIHTVVAGRLIGVNENDMIQLSKRNIHLHVYTEYAHDMRAGIYVHYMKVAPKHFHVHEHISNDKWVTEFSQYDAGWLHVFDSSNHGDLLCANWNDLNMPARIYTLAAAGLPMIQRDNSGHIVSMQNLAKRHGIGIFYKDMDELGQKLSDRKLMRSLQDNMLRCREQFTFDYHVDDLIAFFHKIIAKKQGR